MVHGWLLKHPPHVGWDDNWQRNDEGHVDKVVPFVVSITVVVIVDVVLLTVVIGIVVVDVVLLTVVIGIVAFIVVIADWFITGVGSASVMRNKQKQN